MVSKPTYEGLRQRVQELEKEIAACKRVEKDLFSQQEILQTLADFDREIGHLQLNRIVTSGLDFIQDRMGLFRVSVALLEGNKGGFRLFDVRGEAQEIPADHFLPFEATVLSEVVQGEEAVYRPDILAEKTKYEVDTILTQEGIRSDFLVPLIVQGKCIGTLNSGSMEVDGLRKGFRRTLQRLAPRFAQAILNSQLFEELQESHDELEQRVRKRTAVLAKTTDKLKREVEERRLVMDVLKDREAKARALLNAPTESAMLIDSKGVIIALNETAHKRLGKSSDKLVGANVYELVPADIGKARKAHADKVIRSGEPVRFEDERLGRWFDQTIYPVLNAHGEVHQLAIFAHDITDRKLAQEALKKSHEELEKRVEERTAELTKANEQLNREIEERKRTEEALQASEAQLRHLSSRLLEVQENERKRIAGELHDSIGQSLTAIRFGLENALSQGSNDAPTVRDELLEALIPVVQQASEEVTQIHTNLRPSLLDDLGIISTISWFCREFEKVYANVKIEKELDIEEKEVPEPLKIVMFRVLQEALNNVSKHGKADLVHLSMKRRGTNIELTIQDNGQGFDPDHLASVSGSQIGLGLTSMKERTELSGGVFAIASTPGAGTVVRASWPV